MKICIVSPNFPLYFRRDRTAKFAGAEVQAVFLAGALRDAGHELTVAVANQRPRESFPHKVANAYRSEDGLPVVRFFHPRMTGMQRVFREVNADVYYQRNASMLTGATALFCKRQGRVFVYGAGSNTDFSFREARMDSFRDRLLFYLGLKLADGVVVQNEYQKECYDERHSAPVRVIPNGVNVPADEVPGGRELIVWVGGIRKIKQPELYLELARRLPAHRFVLIGGGSGVEPEFERQIISDAGGIENLQLTGHLSHDETREYLGHAAILVNTSHVEGFPNAYLEAWSRGVPVVSFNDVDGLVARERLGVICRGIDEMETAVRAALEDAPGAVETGKRARKLVAERFSGPVLAARYVEFFEELIARNQRARKRIKKSDTAG